MPQSPNRAPVSSIEPICAPSRKPRASAAGALGGGAAGVVGRTIVREGVAFIAARAGANAAAGAAIGAGQAEANARIASGGRTGASTADLVSSAKQGAVFSAAGSAAGDVATAGAFRAAGGAAREAAISSAETERMVSGQGYPGGANISLGAAGPGGPSPSQVGAVAGQVMSTGVGAAQPPSTPPCADRTQCR